MKSTIKSIWFWVLLVALTLFFSIFEFQKIQLVTLDLGRHLVNGHIFLDPGAFGVTRAQLFNTNLYSYTFPDFPFINHHYGSGVLFYIIYAISGWNGLSLMYVLLVLAAFVFFLLALKDTDRLSYLDILLGGLLLIPLLASRTEIRPEGLSYFFLGLYMYIVYRFVQGKFSIRTLYILPTIQILWANSHIYFIFGPCIVFAFLFETLVQKKFDQAKKLGILLGATLIASCATPFGIHSLIYPFKIFQNYGYSVVENQSVFFLESLPSLGMNYFWFKFVCILLLLSSVYLLTRYKRNAPIAFIGISFVFGILGYLGVRHITPFAFVSIPLLVYSLSYVRQAFIPPPYTIVSKTIFGVVITIISFAFIVNYSHKLFGGNFGIGLTPGIEESAEFVKDNNLRGPIFSNYDIGGYLIWNLFPQEKMFVDNRPEAYPASFFQTEYIPMETNEVVWKNEMEKWHFNMIYFYRQDLTPWAQTFLTTRVTDPAWAPVYVDTFTIIFLRRTPETQSFIQTHELPQSMFSVTQ